VLKVLTSTLWDRDIVDIKYFQLFISKVSC
jgi:hypothetical protein